MASLNKLAIRGIRSFDDKQISVIEFFSPVTVIVGHNGSGKTTIIECLKYATTGDQPPNTRGGAFIHDPKMANEKEVKAQVKLRFHAANGARMLAVRNLSVTVKKTAGLTMKTLESILAADNNSDKGGKVGFSTSVSQVTSTYVETQRGVISTKCAEMDAEIPQLLGVSKAVLENVIFCHQEDSYWPLAEPAALKKKFDDIFEATKYTKALDSIKALRKDRVAELKAEKEQSRIADLNQTIAAKEVEHDETKKAYDEIVISNQKFYDYATRFRELYLRVQNRQENIANIKRELEESRENLQEIPGTDAELDAKLKNSDKDTSEHRRKLAAEKNKEQALEEELAAARKAHTELAMLEGTFKAEFEAQQERLAERELLIQKTSEKLKIKGFASSGLDSEKVLEFFSKIQELTRKQRVAVEKLQRESQAESEGFTRKSTELNNALQAFKAQRTSLQNQLAREKFNQKSRLPSTTSVWMKKQPAQKSWKSRRDALNSEFKSLNMQSDSRAKLELHRNNAKSKNTEISSTDKEKELGELEGKASSANAALQHAQSLLSSLKTQLKAKKEELKGLEKKLKAELEHESLEAALEEASKEVDHRKTMYLELTVADSVAGATTGSSSVYETLLRAGKQKKVCTACNRHMDDHELVVFEKYVGFSLSVPERIDNARFQLKDQMKKSSPESVAALQEELKEWEGEMTRLQGLRPVLSSRDRLKDTEIPDLEAKIKDEDNKIPVASAAADSISEKVEDVKRDIRDLGTLKNYAQTVTRLQKEIKKAHENIADLEKQLSATGSTKTVDDVQSELDELLAEISLLIASGPAMESMDLKTKIREKEALEARIEQMKKEIQTFGAGIKEEEAKIREAQVPIDALEAEHSQAAKALSAEISSAQNAYQELRTSMDRLDQAHKGVENYVRGKRDTKRQECADQTEEVEAEIAELQRKIESSRQVIRAIDKEINESGSFLAALRENLRVRKLAQEIKRLEAEIESEDLEGAAKAKRNFEEKFGPSKDKETKLQTAYSHLAGELSSSRSQLKSLEGDLKDFKDINKKYTDQLIKVKMSDMANSDLEKYGKALDNAIMKYHGLKMEEVNDTMKHLWNKTYQGTGTSNFVSNAHIDGIKIRSDVEGGASKRSYNYRVNCYFNYFARLLIVRQVVMTKDQVEMDMRGRCSAGQKMLASIIIRLALSDSFGQNCGILALDEPTNALDTENIDALAESLVDIIKERRNHANFQLIIITHDENFLRKLGQSDVMEYYCVDESESRRFGFLGIRATAQLDSKRQINRPPVPKPLQNFTLAGRAMQIPEQDIRRVLGKMDMEP
ncbi:hypothetical protein FB451DRAFT_1182155 [Mycena latifolia]|nr:hypothetical protein FB451DRAFT_1182155 [Mycena latifolia]